jgi:Protein of unknown function (DUF3105)
VPGTPRLLFTASLAALAVVVGACGGEMVTTVPQTATTTTTTTGATGAAGVPCEAAHISEDTGEFEGLDPDCREGTPPSPVETADLEAAADAAGCELQLDLRDEGNTHIAPSKTPSYDTAPPTSGDHDQVPLADGAYATPPEERYFVHSMEHGRVVVAYQPSLAEEDQLALKGLVDDDPDGMVLFPYEDMPYEVAATAWTNLLGCDSYSPEVLDAIAAFRDEFRGRGPEAIPL